MNFGLAIQLRAWPLTLVVQFDSGDDTVEPAVVADTVIGVADTEGLTMGFRPRR